MNGFIPADELKMIYSVFGHFYSVQLAPETVVECRSVLEIADDSCIRAGHARLSQRQPDAVFIMMNPGSSQPLVEVHNHIQAGDIHRLPISLVPTKPDTTQYQVMRGMRYCRWRHVRVLNLSDLRCSKSVEFIKQFRQLEEKSGFDAHSIFSERRLGELSRKLPTAREVRLVYAWGLSEKLNPLIERCLSRISGKRTIRGLLEVGTADKYRHPLPSLQRDKLAWLEKMVQCCAD